MRKFKLSLTLLCTLLCVLSLGAFCACEQTVETPHDSYTVTFDADGGNYATGAPDPIPVEEGATLSEAVKNIERPSKPGLSFGNWFLEGEELNAGVKMPAHDVTLVAKYKVGYTVESYLQNSLRNSYLKEEDVLRFSGYVNTEVAPEAPIHNGFETTDTPDGYTPVTSLVLSAQETDNVFRFYYDRMQFSILFTAGNTDTAVTGEMEPLEAYYGSPVTLPDVAFSAPGYRFAGWNSSGENEVEYYPNGLVTVMKNLVLDAVWDKGFTDRYGSEDVIFFPRLEPQKAILLRGGLEFEGTREGDTFSFVTPGGTAFNGKVFGSFYSYERNDLAGTYIYYANTPDPDFPKEELYNENITLTIDPYMTGVYENKTNGHRCEGSIAFSDTTGDYLFTSADETFRFLPASGTQFGGHEKVFSIGHDEEGAYVDFVLVDPDSGMGYLAYSMLLVLDGYSTAALLDANNYLTYDGRYYVVGTETKQNALLYKVVCFFTDTYGYLGGTAGGIVMQSLYTLPLEGEYDGYVVADSFAGSYSNDAGDTIELDGFGIFGDSAKYTVNGVTYTGMYDISSDLVAGSVVTVMADGQRFRFLLDPQTHTFGTPVTVSGNYTEFRKMDGGSLKPPFIILYDEDVYDESTGGTNVLGKYAEIWVPNEDETAIVTAARGYCTVEPLGGNSRVQFNLYRFYRTWAETGYASSIAVEMLFYNTVVTSTTDYQTYNIYCLLGEVMETKDGTGKTERKSYSYQTDVLLDNGETILVCNTVSTTGLGSLYFKKNGALSASVLEGQFSYARSENFNNLLGTFLYASEDGEAVTLYFDIEQGENNTLLAHPVSGPEVMVYLVPATGINENTIGSSIMFYDGNHRAKYTEDNGVSFTVGAYREVGRTLFDEPIYAFCVGTDDAGEGGVEVFRFVLFTVPEYGDDLPLATRFDNTLKNDTFTSDGGGVLTIDHYHAATLDRGDGNLLEGEYHLGDAGGGYIVFTTRDNVHYNLFLNDEDGTFEETDWATGHTWTLLDNNFEPVGNYSISFDGRGTVTARTAGGSAVTGTYRALGTYNETFGYEEYLIRGIGFGTRYPVGNYYVTFTYNNVGEGGCLIYYPAAGGVFIDGDWNILTLDGYTHGSFVTGAFSGSGTFSVVDYNKNFISLTIESETSSVAGQTFYFLLDGDSFKMTDYAAMADVFFAPDMDSIVLGEDGTAYIGTSDGPYYVESGKVYVYLGRNATVFDLPKNGVLTYANKNYYVWDGSPLTMNGVVYLLGKGEEISPTSRKIEATLTFTPNRTTNSNRPATFVLKGQGEKGGDLTDDKFTLNFYTENVLTTVVRYNRSTYPISYSYDLGTGIRSFAVTAGYNSVEYLDHNARYEPDIKVPRGARIYKTSFGFGPITEGETILSGDILYLYKAGDPVYGNPIHFDGVKESDIYKVGYVPSYKDRMEFLFTGSDGVEYALNYYEYYEGGIYFFCYGLYSYKDFETDGYTVRVKTLEYTKMSTAPGYPDAQNSKGEMYALGTVTNVTLFDKTNGGNVIVEYDTGVTPDGYGKGVWIVEYENIVEHGMQGTCTWGEGYLVTFDRRGDEIVGVNVKKYEFVQVVNYAEFLIDLFLDENGDILVAGFAVYNGNFGRYDWVGNPFGYEKTGDMTFTLFGSWENAVYRYTLEIEQSADVTFTQNDTPISKKGFNVTVTSEKQG